MEYLVLGTTFVVGTILGIFIGIFIAMRRIKRGVEEQSVGHLRIDRSESDELPRPFLELQGTTISAISRKKFIILKVINENYISRD